jgi:hypothetical protein
MHGGSQFYTAKPSMRSEAAHVCLRYYLVRESDGMEQLRSIFALFDWRERRAEQLPQMNIRPRHGTASLLQND